MNILLADDDQDDRTFFERALKETAVSATLTTVDDGEKLLNRLNNPDIPLPDVIFLDLNMPKIKGEECLARMKKLKYIQDIPVIIYSTSFIEEVADSLYEAGAHYYLKKPEYSELPQALKKVLGLIQKNRNRPLKENFVVNHVRI